MSTPADHVHELVDDYLHDLLTPEEDDRVERHCSTCPDCARSLEQARQRRLALRALPPVEAPPQLVVATIDRVAAYDRRRALVRRRALWASLASVAAAVLVLSGLHAYFYNLKPTSTDVMVLGQQQLLAGSHSSVRVRVVNRATQEPRANVPVKVELRGPNVEPVKVAETTTDANGNASPRFVLPDWQDGDYQLCVIATVEDKEEALIRPIALKRSWQVMLSSDKPVYKPGQLIRLRSLALRRPDLKPVGNEKVTFAISDPKGNVIFKRSDTPEKPSRTSKFGIAAADCELDTEVIEGAYAISCKVGDTESKLAIEVRKYVLPKFKVEVKLDRPYYAPGETVKVLVQANYFFGKPVANGVVDLEVRTSDVGERVLKKLLGVRTDAKGTFEVRFPVPAGLVGRPGDSGDARLSFVAHVTDSAGQEQFARAERLVTRSPLHVEVLPEGGSVVAGVENQVYVLVSEANGAPVSGARVSVTGAVTTELRTDESGLAVFTVKPDGTRSMDVTIRARDGKGREAQGPHILAWAGHPLNDFLVRTDRATYKAGQTMELTALGTGRDPIFVDFLKDGQTMLTETIDLDGGRGTRSFDLPVDLFGTLRLVAYRINREGVPVRKTRIVYVRPATGLQVRATLDADEYRPGRKAKLNVSLTDATGKPVAGGVSLAAVDEAVFAVLPQRPGMEQTFYTLEQGLLEPVYAIYPAWEPRPAPQGNLPEAERAARFDQALFSTTASAEGAGAIQRFMRVRAFGRRPTAAEPTAAHTLAENSFPAKEKQVAAERARALWRVGLAWAALVALVLASGYVVLWLVRPKQEVLIAHGVALCFLLPIGCLGGMAWFLAGRSASKSASADAEMATSARIFRKSGAAPLGADWDRAAVLLPEGRQPAPAGRVDPEAEEAPAPRVRESFPETLLWRPLLITDDQGRLPPQDVELADSITTWRLSASAVSGDGRLGAVQLPLKVFQPFFVDVNLPVSLTRNDEVGVPVVVSNYDKARQTVRLKVEERSWFALLSPAEQTVELGPGEVRELTYRVRVREVGTHKFQVEARGKGVSDAVNREVEVVPDGRRVETAFSGSLDKSADLTLNVPADAIEGSVKAFVKVYPSSFSQLVEGLQNIFRLPTGCFEQTSSATYPNVLALDYLKRTGQRSPDVEAKARQYIHLGYQRLLGFEVQGGGFDWYGRPPANLTLTAYGLMEFTDMARVHDVDPALIDRTRNWLLSKRQPDGSWAPEGRGVHGIGAGRDDKARLSLTAYVAWAVFADGKAAAQASSTRSYLLAKPAAEIDDPNVLALVCNALLALEPKGDATPYLNRLEALKQTTEGGKFAHWDLPAGGRTTFYGAGPSGSIETTALAALALIQGQRHPATARAALAWLVSRKDPSGTWYSTQATVLSLRALLAGTGKALAGDGARRLQVRVGEHVEEIAIPADQAEVMKQIELSKHLKAGAQTVTLTEKTRTGPGYQVTLRYHLPEKKAEAPEGPLSIAMSYDRTELAVNEVVKAKARVVNRTKSSAPMVMLDLPIPPGFALNPDEFARMVQKGTIGRFQVRPRTVIVYLRDLPAEGALELSYVLRAQMPVKVKAQGARAYEYYNPHAQGRSAAVSFTVTARE